jgi:N6-L-threonylcarbamoyladenine synthase
MRVLAIESSCDESAVAILDDALGLLAHELHSQVDLHRVYGGVVPELASRDHLRRLPGLLRAALAKAREATGAGIEAVDGIAYAAGPGLVGALLTGAGMACGLAFARGIPALPVHHLEGHLLAPLLGGGEAPPLPHLALLVSGGHTMLVAVRALGEYQVLGETRDDAAGEAFDKSAKLLGLPYPGGPELARLAADGRPGRYRFPRPLLDRPGLEFSFSGLKTAVALAARDLAGVADAAEAARMRADIAHAVQEAIVETLVGKTLRAVRETGLTQVVVAGGVGANRLLRERLAEGLAPLRGRAFHPPIEFCTDNAAMIAVAGLARLRAGQRPEGLAITARAQWPLQGLAPPGPAASIPLPSTETCP